jgi:hypothetical protein
LGTDGSHIVYPVRGIVQGARRASRNPEKRTIAYLLVLAAATVATAVGLLWAGYTLGSPVTVVALAVVAVFTDRGSVRVTRTTELTISVIPMLVAAVLFGPLAAGFVGATSQLGDPELARGSRSGTAGLKWATYTCIRFLAGVATGFASQAVIGAVPSEFGGLFVATLIGATVAELLESALALLTSVVRGGSLSEGAKLLLPPLAIVAPIYTPVVALLAYMYVFVSPWALALFLVPAMAAQRLHALYQQERQLASDLSVANRTLEEANLQLEQANLQFASLLVTALDARDEYTAGHSEAVAIYARDIAKRMSLSEEIQERAYLCGLVHDIGKIGLPAGLLEKPGALTLEERREMEKHSAIGEGILREIKSEKYREFPTIVRHHHERIDGEGYPDRLRSDDIPLVSRIIAVADAYNAMTSKRPYRDAMPSRVARHRLAQAVDSQFDTAVVAAFEAVLASADEDYRLARSTEFKRFADSVYVTPPELAEPVADVA